MKRILLLALAATLSVAPVNAGPLHKAVAVVKAPVRLLKNVVICVGGGLIVAGLITFYETSVDFDESH